MNKRKPVLFILLLLVLVTGNFAVTASHKVAKEAVFTSSVKENNTQIPFYQDRTSLFSSPGLVFPYIHTPETGSFFLLFTPFQTGNIITLIRLRALVNTPFALLYKCTILFPFHSFW